MRDISTTIAISASPQAVWDVIADLPGYAEWNPFIREASGELVPGTVLTLRRFPRDGRPAVFRPRVTTVRPGRELRLLDRLLLPCLLEAEHRLELVEAP